jgi:hypothetical protein
MFPPFFHGRDDEIRERDRSESRNDRSGDTYFGYAARKYRRKRRKQEKEDRNGEKYGKKAPKIRLRVFKNFHRTQNESKKKDGERHEKEKNGERKRRFHPPLPSAILEKTFLRPSESMSSSSSMYAMGNTATAPEAAPKRNLRALKRSASRYENAYPQSTTGTNAENAARRMEKTVETIGYFRLRKIS